MTETNARTGETAEIQRGRRAPAGTPPACAPGAAAPSRRSVLSAAAGAGAAGIAAAALGRAASAVPHGDQAGRASASGARQREAVIVHVRDVASGEIDLFRGTAKTSVRDRALALRIVRASR